MAGGMPTRQRPIYALGLRLAAMLALSVMLLLVKLTGEHGIGLPETLFWRQFLPGIALLGWLAARGEIGRLYTKRPLIHARRALIGGLGMFLTLGVVQILPLAEATVLGRSLAIVARLAQRLMVGRVPHEAVVATVRRDVIDDGGSFNATRLTTAHAHRVRLQEGDPVALPPGRVAPRCRCPAPCVLLPLSLRLVPSAHTSAVHQDTASRAW